jgi:hypothetical protein
MKNAKNNSSKVITKFYCEKCDYGCSKKGDYTKHIHSIKHNAMKCYKNANKNSPNKNKLLCECGKIYKHQSSYSRHKKNCDFMVSDSKSDEALENISNKDFMSYLLKENQEMKNMMIDMCKQIQPQNTTNNTTNNNQIFNINMFLNEQCKDALNMSEFIESIQLTIQDIAKIGEQGQTKGMSNILIDKLNSLDVFKRPLHCSDIKKEIIYVKDEDKWVKDDKERPKLKHALDNFTKKSIQILPDIQQEPDDFVRTVNELLKEPREDKKIISSLAKETCL